MGKRTTPFLVLVILYPTFAMNDYCRNNTFDKPTDSDVLHFSKENSDVEFGIFDKFKCLHCCAHGYRSIEWFKNGQAYPWPTDISTLIIHPESGNQTVCSQQSTSVDSGRYWCVARNDTHFLRHEVLLQISGPSISMGWPKTTYRPRDQKAERGKSARFYCEAFVGTIDLPDFQSEIAWERYDLNQSFIDGERVFQEAVFREEKRILGSYLYFKRVTPKDYGEYTCKVRNLGDQVVKLSAWLKPKEMALSQLITGREQFLLFLFFLLCFLILLISISTVCLLRFGFMRVLRSRVSQSSGCHDDVRKDVLVIYHKKDEQEALKIISVLRGKCFCSYSLHPLQSVSQMAEENLKAKANSYRAVLAFLSSSFLDGVWSCEVVHLLIQNLLKVHFTIACIFLEAIPKPKPNSTEWQLLRDSLSKIHYVDRSNGHSLKFWSIIRQKFSFEKKSPGLRESSQALI